MAQTKKKGDLGEVIILADIMKKGYKAAMPIGEDWRYDLIVERRGKLERVQCKYTESDGKRIKVRCKSSNNWSTVSYTSSNIDWLAVYDKTSDSCFYIPSELLGENGRREIYLRLKPTKNNQKKNVRLAEDYKEF